MENPSLQIGGGDWAVKETKLLGTNPVLNRKIPVEIDVTNATIGTRVNKEGFIENGPRNLLTFSETFDNAVWVKNDTVVLSTNNANPFGKLNATKLGFTLQNNPNFQQVISTVPGKVFTTSFYVRRVSGNATIYLRVGSLNPNNINPTSVWQRFSVTGVTDSTTGRCTIGAVSPVLGVDVIEIWGAQLEENSIATEYYLTTTRTNLARIDYSSGEAVLLIEPQRTNSLTNSELAGASLPSTLPTNFNVNGSGLNFSVVGIGKELGLNYVDVRWFGIPNVNSNIGIRTSSSNAIAATQGQTWTSSCYLKIVSQPLPPTSFSLSAYERSSTGLYLNGQGVVHSNTTLQRVINTLTLTNASTVAIQQDITANVVSGLSYDFTIRIAAPQIEQGAYATSYIPTLGSAVTRNADLISKTGINNLIGQTEGVLFIETATLSNEPITRAIALSDGTSSNRIYITYFANNNTIQIAGTSNGVFFSNVLGYILPYNASEFAKIALRYKVNDISLWVNGVKTGTLTSQSLPLSLNRIAFDSGGGSSPFYGKAKEIFLYKNYLSDAEMIELTTI
jgi:hypothetical protein